MAVNWGSLIFGGVDSSEYGIYLSGEGVYNAPERVVEVVDVPGRNGSVIIDQGHWNNIEVVYRAGVFGADQAGFSEKLSAFRNAILSQTGYQRLSDTYHPEEFRMGAYVSGLEVSPASYNRHGEFELIFNCKPQRFLIDGNIPIPLDSGDVLQNFTPYNSSPLIHAWGYGNLTFNGYTMYFDASMSQAFGAVEINLKNTAIDYKEMDLSDPSISRSALPPISSWFDVGDYFYMTNPSGNSRNLYSFAIFYDNNDIPGTPTNRSFTEDELYGYSNSATVYDDYTRVYMATGNKITRKFQAGVASTSTFDGTFSFKIGDETQTFTLTSVIAYNGTDTVQISQSITKTAGSYTPHHYGFFNQAYVVKGTSTATPDGIYLDCENGESYSYIRGELVPTNGNISLGSDLPVLPPGPSQVTFDNTFTEVQITPRWWLL